MGKALRVIISGGGTGGHIFPAVSIANAIKGLCPDAAILFIGAGFVVLLYIVLLFRAARIASRCDNNFPAFLVLGLALMLVIQASFNMMVAVGIAPVTGQPLPLISRGGTSTIINCAYIGAILSVSRSAKKRVIKCR